jgi:RNA polymerase sigma-70 factor (ECF subfamily)
VAFSTTGMNIEERLITQCMQGDRKAQLLLYDLCYSYMMSICLRYCRDKHEAGSRLNLSFLKVLKHLDQYDQNSSFKAWISTITLRSIIDEFRSQQKHYQHHVYNGELPQEKEWTDATVNQIAEGMDLDHLLMKIHQLPPLDRQVFNLFAIDGYGHKEIAAMLNMSEGTSKWHVHEARRKLKEALLKETKKASLK